MASFLLCCISSLVLGCFFCILHFLNYWIICLMLFLLDGFIFAHILGMLSIWQWCFLRFCMSIKSLKQLYNIFQRNLLPANLLYIAERTHSTHPRPPLPHKQGSVHPSLQGQRSAIHKELCQRWWCFLGWETNKGTRGLYIHFYLNLHVVRCITRPRALQHAWALNHKGLAAIWKNIAW